MSKAELRACPWAGQEDFYLAYHDDEWGVPCYDSRRLFAMLCLEGAQAGLSWRTILLRRPQYYAAFDDFDPEKMAAYDAAKREALRNDSRIIRNRAKIDAFIGNAQAYLRISARQSFADYLWALAGGSVKVNHFRDLSEVPAQTAVSQAMSKQLKKDGFRFVGPTICYAFMQSVGMVNDHLLSCYRHPVHQGNDKKVPAACGA